MPMKRVPEPESRESLDLPLRGFFRLYETNLKAERKTPKTITVYRYVLTKFADWFERASGRAPLLSDLSSSQVRTFLVAVQETPKWHGHPTLDSRVAMGVSGATLHSIDRVPGGGGDFGSLTTRAIGALHAGA